MLNLLKTLFTSLISLLGIGKNFKMLPEPDSNSIEPSNGHDGIVILENQKFDVFTEEIVDVVPSRRFTVDDEGWLVGEKVYKATTFPRSDAKSKLLTKGQPLGVVTHATATARGTAETIWKAWHRHNGPQDNHSAHLTIESDGSVFQSIPFKRSAWHGGGSVVLPNGMRARTNAFINGVTPNSSTISIEITNLGEVRKKKDDKWRGWSSNGGVGTGTSVKEEDTIKIGKRQYHSYTEEQRETWKEILLALTEEYPTLTGKPVTVKHSPETLKRMKSLKPEVLIERIHLTHHDIDPVRKWDPGPAWEFPELL